MREISLTGGIVTLVDDEDYERLAAHTWSLVRKDATVSWRVRRAEQIGGKIRRFYMHREIMAAPKGLQVDHIDGNPLNNQRANLRLATASQNGMNRPKRKCKGPVSSPFKGVTRNRQNTKWVAGIRVEGVAVHGGSFDRDDQAARAYDALARKHHGEFARLNFPDDNGESFESHHR